MRVVIVLILLAGLLLLTLPLWLLPDMPWLLSAFLCACCCLWAASLIRDVE